MKDRLDLLSALDAAAEHRDELMSVLGRADNPDSARTAVMELLEVSLLGANAVLAMQLRRFSASERAKVHNEVSELRQQLRGLS